MQNKTTVESCHDEFPSSHAFDVITATVRFAERCADLTTIYMRYLLKRPNERRRVEVPSEVALELGGILQIWLWEQTGLREYLDRDLPSSEEAFASLATRTTASPDAYLEAKSGSALSQKVLAAFLLCCSHTAPRELGVDIVILGSPDESLLEEFADFVWQHRNLLRLES